MKKHFMVPCFVLVDIAQDVEKAKKLAARHATMKNGSVLMLDSELPTVEVPAYEYPNTMKGHIVK